MDIPSIVTGHCTGDDAVLILEEVLGERLQRLYTGLVMEF
jgi:metal-dependent hydrolase (beta-lactamase superfamily II)